MLVGASCPGSPKRDSGTASSSHRMSALPPNHSASAERRQQPARTEEWTSGQSLDNPQGGAGPPADAAPAAADACKISKQPEELQSASLNDVNERKAERAAATALDSKHQKPRWGQRHAPAVSWQLSVTSARPAASGQPREPTSHSTGLSTAFEAAQVTGNNKGRDCSPARPEPPRHLDVQSALWRPPPPKARPLPPLPEFAFTRSMDLPSPSHDTAHVQSLGAAMEVSTLFADKPHMSELKPLEEKAPGSEPDTPELLKELKTGLPTCSSEQKAAAGSGDAGDARAEGGCVRSGSHLTPMPGKSSEVARLQETLASLASLKLSLGSSSASPDCSITASSALSAAVSAGHVSLRAGEAQQVAVSSQAPPSNSVCAAGERAAGASSACRGAPSQACSRIADSTWIYNPAAHLENGHASPALCEGACTDLSDPEQQDARKMGAGHCMKELETAEKGSLPDVSFSAGGLPSKVKPRQAPAVAGEAPQGPQQKDSFNARCPGEHIDAASSQQV